MLTTAVSYLVLRPPRWVMAAVMIIVGLFFMHCSAWSQSLNYHVKVNNKTIGLLNVQRIRQNDIIYYLIKGSAQYHCIFRFDMEVVLENVYQNGRLVKAMSQESLNTKERNYVCIHAEGHHYFMTTRNDKKVLSAEDIHHSLALLFFTEPANLTKVFSERLGQFVPVRQVTSQTYELLMPDGKKHYYTYQHGRCVKVDINYSLTSFSFVIHPQS